MKSRLYRTSLKQRNPTWCEYIVPASISLQLAARRPQRSDKLDRAGLQEMKRPQQEVIGNYQALAWVIHHFRVCISGANATRSKTGRSGLVQKQLLRRPLGYSVVLTHSLHVLIFHRGRQENKVQESWLEGSFLIEFLLSDGAWPGHLEVWVVSWVHRGSSWLSEPGFSR